MCRHSGMNTHSSINLYLAIARPSNTGKQKHQISIGTLTKQAVLVAEFMYECSPTCTGAGPIPQSVSQ